MENTSGGGSALGECHAISPCPAVSIAAVSGRSRQVHLCTLTASGSPADVCLMRRGRDEPGLERGTDGIDPHPVSTDAAITVRRSTTAGNSRSGGVDGMI